MAWGYGLKSAKMGIENTGVVADMPTSTGKKNMYIFDIDNGEYIKLRGVDFGTKGAKQFNIAAASTGGVTINLRLDSNKGPVVGTITIGKTGSVEKQQAFMICISVSTKLTATYIWTGGSLSREGYDEKVSFDGTAWSSGIICRCSAEIDGHLCC